MTSVNCPVVGIGGSAGAVDALRRLFGALSGSPALCYLVVVHQSRDQDSALNELVSGWSGLPATMASDGAPLEQGRIVVAPPGAYIEVQRGVVRVTPRATGTHHQDVIDRLFASLAAEAGAQAVAVVLSGNGDDGLKGAEAVKRAGGRVIAQDPATCFSDAMPLNVIRRGLAAATLAPESIAQALVTPLSGQEAADEPAQDAAALAAILDLVRAHSGNDLSGYKVTTLRRRIDRRAALMHCESLAAYLVVLRQDLAELDRLAKDMFIGVTAFLRDPEAFKILEAEVVPELCRSKPADEAVRVWVAGCSTGEEAYSVAMLFHDWFDAQHQPLRLQIFATDIDDAALEVARVGRYRSDALLPLPESWRSRYFVETGEGLAVSKAIREAVVFASHNLISDPPFSRLDLLVCRNVLIYLSAETQRKLMTLFHFVLRAGGYLFLGSSETTGAMGDKFEPLNKQWRIYRHLGTPAARRPPSMLVTGGLSARRGPGGVDIAADMGALAGQERIYRHLIEDVGPAQILINQRMDILFTVGDSTPYLQYPSGEPTHDLFKLVRPELRVPLRAVVTRAQREAAKVNVVTQWNRGTAQAPVEEGLRLTAAPALSQDEASLLVVSLERDPDVKTSFPAARTESEDWLLQQMEQELDATREDLQRTIERMRVSNEETKAANEEIMAMNEELQSSNEELESSKEELQSLNEELASTNAVLDNKISELERTNADLSNLLVSTETATLFLDADLRIRRFTQACTQLMRVIPADVGRSLTDIVQITQNHDLIADCHRVLAGQAVPDQEIQSADGRWYMRRILPYRDGVGSTAGVVLTFPEVTAIKASEAELARRNEELVWQANLLREAPVIGLGMDDRVIFWSAGAESLYGWSDQEARGKPAHELLRSQFPVALQDVKATLEREGAWHGRVTQVRRDGEQLVVDSKWSLQRDSEGRGIAVVSVNIDVTARVAAEEQLARYRDQLEDLVRERTAQAERARQEAEQANRAKGEFLSHMSHELRTPLNTVIGYAQLLAGADADAIGEPQREQAKKVQRAGQHLLHLVNDVLNLSLIDTGNVTLSRKPIVLVEAVHAAVEAASATSRARNVTLTNQVSDAALRAVGDPVRLHQVLLNLLSNAIKYNVDGGRVTVSATPVRSGGDTGWVSVEIVDTGRGMTEQQLAHLFEPFNRLGAERSSIEGTGIGLTITRRLIERMGGRIEVSSAPGEGSRFRLLLRAAEPGVRPVPEPTGSVADVGSPGRLRVLYVEDQPINAELVLAMTETDPRIELTVARSGTEALEAVRQDAFDLMLIDMHLGDMDGKDLLARLRDFGLAADTRFVALSADAMPDQIAAALAAGFHRYLTKPLMREALFAELEDAIASRQGDANTSE